MKNMSILLITFLFLISCNNDEQVIQNDTTTVMLEYEPLPIRSGQRPETTANIPHVQIDVDLVPEVHKEMVRRIYSVPGIEDQPSVVLSWQGLSIKEGIALANPDALIGDREYAHIHDDGSLHIFLEPKRAAEAVEAGWAIDHPFALQNPNEWNGFVMLYTPQTIEECDVTFQLIVDGYNFVTGQNLIATDFY